MLRKSFRRANRKWKLLCVVINVRLSVHMFRLFICLLWRCLPSYFFYFVFNFISDFWFFNLATFTFNTCIIFCTAYFWFIAKTYFYTNRIFSCSSQPTHVHLVLSLQMGSRGREFLGGLATLSQLACTHSHTNKGNTQLYLQQATKQLIAITTTAILLLVLYQ